MMVEHKGVSKNVERVSRAGVGLVVISCIVVESPMAVDGPFSDQRSLAHASWGQWVTLQCLWPSQNEWGVVIWLVEGWGGMS